jgi:hypothetical protein
MKAVLDTNVYVSMLLSPRGAGAWLMALWREQKFEIVFSSDLYDELIAVLNRPEIAPRIDLQRKIALLRRLRYDALWTSSTVDTSGMLPDPNDDFLLSAALEVDAAFIVTWDTTLLAVGNCRGVQIATPDQFISLIVSSR